MRKIAVLLVLTLVLSGCASNGLPRESEVVQPSAEPSSSPSPVVTEEPEEDCKAKGYEYDEFTIAPSERTVEEEFENLLDDIHGKGKFSTDKVAASQPEPDKKPEQKAPAAQPAAGTRRGGAGPRRHRSAWPQP